MNHRTLIAILDRILAIVLILAAIAVVVVVAIPCGGAS